MKYFYCLLLTLITLPTGQVNAQAFYRKDTEASVVFFSEQDNQTARQFFSLINSCSKIIHASLGRRSNHSLTKVFLRESNNSPKPPNSHTFTYNEIQQMSHAGILHLTHSLLLNNYYNRTQTPQWLIAALVHRSSHSTEKHLHLQSRYVYTRHSLSHGLTLDLGFMQDEIIPQDTNTYSYLYFSELSDVLLSALIRRGDSKVHLQRVLKSDFTNSKLNESIIQNALDNSKKTNTSPSKWFTQEAEKIIYNTLYPISIEELCQKLDALNTATIFYTDELGVRQLKTLPIEDLSLQASIDNTYVLTIIAKLISLINDSPSVSRAPLLRIKAALEQLRTGDKKNFRKEILKAKQELQQIKQHVAKASQWLNEVESQHLSSQQTYLDLLKAHQNHEQETAKSFPKELKWLNELERKLDSL